MRARKMAGLKDGLPLFGGASVPLLVVVVVVVVGLVGIGGRSRMVMPIFEQDIVSPSSGVFTLGTERFNFCKLLQQVYFEAHSLSLAYLSLSAPNF